MAGTAVAVFPEYTKAKLAAQALLDGGVPFSDISLVRIGAGGEHGEEIAGDEVVGREHLSSGFREVETHDVEEAFAPRREVAPRAAVGLVTGASIGALAASFAILVPGIGALMAAGPLTAMLGSTVAGGAVGSLFGALTHDGIPEADARRYHEHVSSGSTLVTVLVSKNQDPHVAQILRESGGQDLGFFPRLIDSLQTIESVGGAEKKAE